MIGLSFSNNLDNELSYNKIEINEEAINFDSDTDWNLWVAFDDDDEVRATRSLCCYNTRKMKGGLGFTRVGHAN